MTTNRTIQLLFYLLRHRKTTAVHLADEFGVSLRTIYRDLDQLSQAGIPIYTTTGRNGGISLMEDFLLDRTFFTQQEQTELMMALSSLAATGFAETQAVQEKLASLRKEDSADPLWVNFTRWGADQTQASTAFKQLKQTILNQQALKIYYINGKGKESWRTIEPLKLVFQQNQWYLFGYCRNKSDLRLFRLSRILSFHVLNETFERVASIEEYFSQVNHSFGEKASVELLTDQTCKHRLVDIFGAEVVKQIGDQVQVSVQLPIDDWLVSFCLSLGSALKEIKPRKLQDQVATAHLQAYQQISRRN
ncbi:helix-turn-helix transcriptional regulator [Enterococcus sp. AZ109]|uniref:helix-turn-helix transcriptional regulator n=1 Tax=Enterococcus sp. AZ109 TaxID=2774634 RepID=UPI003F206988